MDAVYARRRLPFRRVADLSVAHLGERRLFFNESGTTIWELIDGKRTVREIAHALTAASSTGSPELLARATASVHQFASTLQGLNVLDLMSPGTEAAAAPPPLATPSSRAPSSDHKAEPKPLQDACATPHRKKMGAWSVRKNREAGATLSIEERFNDVCWDHCYIQKMHVELTYRCNFRCIQCYNTTHAATDREMSVDEWRRTFEQLAALGCQLLTFTGGEVFVRKDVVDILQAACDNGFSFRINTNGSLINEAMLQKLEPMRPFLQCFDVSFYGATPQVHDTLARRLGAYQATLRAVKSIADAKMPLNAKFVTMRDNFEGIAKWKADMRELGVRHGITTGTLIPRTDRDTTPLVQVLTDEQFKDLLTIEHLEEVSGSHFCRPGHVRGAITPDGFVSPCEWLTDFKFGNVRERPLRDVWYSDESRAFRNIFEEEASECPSCELRPGCSRCPARSYLETGHLQKCAPGPRHFAEVFQQVKHAG
jgi:radical SAM protein with 4Fe4S-binding SPASM domain